jgi:hypothetical protein
MDAMKPFPDFVVFLGWILENAYKAAIFTKPNKRSRISRHAQSIVTISER